MTAPAEDPRGGEATEELREAIAETLWPAQPEFFVSPWLEISETTRERYRAKVDALLALPAVAALLNAQAAVERVEALAEQFTRGDPTRDRIRRALDGAR